VSFLPEPLSIPGFRYFWIARLSSTIGQMAMVIVIGWQVYDIARHTMGVKEAALRLGLIGVVQFVPLFLLTLVTGWTADRVDRRWIGRAAVGLELACAAALAWFAWSHTTTLPILYAVAALLGVARAFAGPALAQSSEKDPQATPKQGTAKSSSTQPAATPKRLDFVPSTNVKPTATRQTAPTAPAPAQPPAKYDWHCDGETSDA